MSEKVEIIFVGILEIHTPALHRPLYQKGCGLISVRAHIYIVGSIPGQGIYGRQLIDVFLSLNSINISLGDFCCCLFFKKPKQLTNELYILHVKYREMGPVSCMSDLSRYGGSHDDKAPVLSLMFCYSHLDFLIFF